MDRIENKIRGIIFNKYLMPLLFFIAFGLTQLTVIPDVDAQDYNLTVAVLINSINTSGYNANPANPGEYQRYPERYLEHLQVPYQTFDVSSQSPPADLSSRQLIIIGHKGVNLPSNWQTAVINAVNGGTGLVNLDWATNIGTTSYVQTIFGATGSSAGTPGIDITVPQDVAQGGATPHYIAAMQKKFLGDLPGDFVYNFHVDKNNILQTATSTVLAMAGGTVIARIGSDPFIVATAYGSGRAVHFGTLDYLRADRFGFLMGIDDLFWRSLVWAARKPFVLRGYPRLWAVQMDDTFPGWGFRVRDIYDPTFTGNVAPDGTGGPWKLTGYLYTDNLPQGGDERASVTADIRQGLLKVAPHTFGNVTYGNLYWNDGSGALTDTQWSANLSQVLQWKQGLGGNDTIPSLSRSLVAHYWDISDNTGYDLWNSLGYRYVTSIQKPGFRDWADVTINAGAERPHARPFWLYEQPPKTVADENYSFFFADDYTINSRSGYASKTFFLFASQLHDPGLNYPRPDAIWPSSGWNFAPADSISQFERYTWRFWSSLAPVQLFTHDAQNYEASSASDRQAVIGQVSAWLQENGVHHVFMEGLGDYVYSRSKSVLTDVHVSGSNITYALTGNAATADGAPINTDVFVFFDNASEGVRQTIPGFTGGTISTQALPPAPPAITGVTPPTGPAAGGTSITISGTNFINVTAVEVGGTPVLDLVVDNSAQITAETPPGLTGPADVIVMTTSGMTTFSNGFTYTGPPVIDSITPAYGAQTGGTLFTVKGRGFETTSTISIGGALCTGITFVDSSTLTAMTPAGTPGDANVDVTNSQGTTTVHNGFFYLSSSNTIRMNFTYASRTALLAAGWDFLARTSLGATRDTEQTSGLVVSYDQTAHPGVLRIPIDAGDIWEGTNDSRNTLFYSLPDVWRSIRLKASGISLNDDNQEVCVVAYQDDDNYVLLCRAFNSDAPGNQVLEFGAESLGSYDVITRVAAAGSVCYLRLDRDVSGNVFSAFASTDGVNWGPLSGSVTRTLTSPRLGILAGANGSTTSFPTADIQFAEIVAFVADPLPPTVSSVSPPSGSTAGGTVVQISGTGFVPGSTVKIGGTSATSVIVNSDISISAVTPANAAGAADVAITNTNGTGTLTGGFIYYTPGSTLFSDDFNDGNATGWTISPLGNGTAWSVVSGAYTNIPPPVLVKQFLYRECLMERLYPSGRHTLSTLSDWPGGIRGRVNPASGAGYAAWLYPAEGGIILFSVVDWDIDNGYTELGRVDGITFDTTSFHTLGLSFTGSTIKVYFDGLLVITATDTTYNSGLIALDVSNQTVEFDNISVVFGTPVFPPAISSINPPSGSTAGGTVVQINGSGFISGSTVTIGGVSATGVVINSSTSITATTPAGTSGAADVVVTNTNGTGTLTGGFTYYTPGSTLFTDDFNDGNANGWTISPLGNASGWSVVGGIYTYNGSGLTNSYTGSASWSDYTLVAGIKLSSLSDLPGGIRGRVNLASGAGYAVWLYPAEGQIKLFRATGWDIDSVGQTQLGPTANGITFDTNFHSVWLNFSGTTITVYFDGTPVITASDATYGSGVIALDVNNQPIQFDNVSVIFGIPVLPPAVSSVSPPSGSTLGGTAVQINGSGFISGSTVTIGGASATGVVVNGATSISAVTPSGGAGGADVVVTNANGTGTLTGGFEYITPGSTLLSDDFSGGAGAWTISPLGILANWNASGDVLSYNGGGLSNVYRGDPFWSDYSFQADIRLYTLDNWPGGIRGRVNPTTGAGYAVWLYPADGYIKLFNAPKWDINDASTQLLMDVGGISFDTTSFHTVGMTFSGSTIKVYYDGALVITATDSTYTSGLIALDVSDQPVDFDNVIVTTDKANQTIAVTTHAPVSAAYNSTFNVAATASSGLDVAITSSGSCSGTGTGSAIITMTSSTGACSVNYNQAGDSIYNGAPQVSETTTAQMANQTISFGALGDKTYGDSPFTVSATATSGLTVSFSSQTTSVCTVTGTTVTIVASGICTVRASQGGNSNYNAAPNVDQPFTINKANQATVTVNATSPLTYGGSTGTATASGGSGTGAYSYSAGGSTACSVNSSTGVITVTSGTGTCSITATRAGDSNYNVSAVSAAANVTINKANQATVTVNATSPLTYGGSTGTATASGGSGTGAYNYSAGSSTACSVGLTTGVITVTSGTGTCAITATRLGDSNYNVSAVSAAANVTINKANQATVTVNATSPLTYGGSTGTATASGGSGTGAYNYSAGSSTACSVGLTTGVITVTSGTGTCAITATRLGDSNYNVSAVSAAANVTINKANQATVTVNATSPLTYGGSTGTATASGGSGTGAYNYSAGSSTACSVGLTTGVITVTSGTGTCAITATRLGDSNYNVSAVSAAANVTINKANQATVTVNATSPLTYGGSTGTATASGGSGTGAYNYSAGSSTACSVGLTTGVITVTSGTGTCAITATRLGDSNYNVSAVSAAANVTINKANQATVTVIATSPLTYGGSTGTATASGGSGTGAYSYSAGASTACSVNAVTGVITMTSGTGTCSITATRAGDSNYNTSAASAAANVTINKANQAITFGALPDKTADDVPFAVSATSDSGLAVSFSSLTTGVCTVTPDGTVTLTHTSVDTCTIRASQGGNENYNAAPDVDQSFAVNAGPVWREFGGIPVYYYSTIQAAFDGAADQDVIQTQLISIEEIDFRPPAWISITLQAPAGHAAVKSMTITNGAVTVDGLWIQ